MSEDAEGPDKDGCYLHSKPFNQCCCNCRKHVPDHHHCTRDPLMREQLKRCVCGIQKGWICAGFMFEPGPEDHVGQVHSNWPEHSVGCEMYDPVRK